VGGFATAFDLVASSYGYTDYEIGELPLARLRQMTAAIQIRRYQTAREENSRTSWLARQIATYIAAGFETPKGKENEALKQAQQLAYDDVETALLKMSEEVQDNIPAEDKNKPGSFERFMQTVGSNPTRG